MMTVEDNKALVRSYIENAINRRDLSQFDSMIADAYIAHGFMNDRDEQRRFLSWQAKTAPDWHIQIEDIFGEGDRVAVRAVATGIRTESSPGVAYPSPTQLHVDWITIFRIEDGLLAESWVVSDAKPVAD